MTTCCGLKSALRPERARRVVGGGWREQAERSKERGPPSPQHSADTTRSAPTFHPLHTGDHHVCGIATETPPFIHGRPAADSEPERSGDRQPQAARRVNEVNQLRAPAGTSTSGGRGRVARTGGAIGTWLRGNCLSPVHSLPPRPRRFPLETTTKVLLAHPRMSRPFYRLLFSLFGKVAVPQTNVRIQV
jgi:hypothetical protein